MSTVTQQIIKRIRAKRRGWVFAPKDFLDLGSRAIVDQALSRLVRQKIIRRLDRGVYDFPKQHAVLGILSPDANGLARAVAPKAANKIFASGALAANTLGLSTQVPAKPTYTTNGPSHAKKIAGRTVIFKHAKVPLFDSVSDTANLTLQALAHLGKNNIDDAVLQRCANALTDRDVRCLVAHTDRTPSWLAEIILKIKQVKNGRIREKA
ncbi:MAG: DUF6088 family protein [Desulfobulbus sp.]|nr:DUF6088 family protein [Desulfobulbus sp.]